MVNDRHAGRLVSTALRDLQRRRQVVAVARSEPHAPTSHLRRRVPGVDETRRIAMKSPGKLARESTVDRFASLDGFARGRTEPRTAFVPMLGRNPATSSTETC